MTRRIEQKVQRTVLEHLEVRAVPGLYWFHVGNGGWRSPIEARVFKGLGVKPGVPDLILIHAGRTYGLELKAEHGKLTPYSARPIASCVLLVPKSKSQQVLTPQCVSLKNGGC